MAFVGAITGSRMEPMAVRMPERERDVPALIGSGTGKKGWQDMTVCSRFQTSLRGITALTTCAMSRNRPHLLRHNVKPRQKHGRECR